MSDKNNKTITTPVVQVQALYIGLEKKIVYMTLYVYVHEINPDE